MATTDHTLDRIMEQASAALAATDYHACERWCMEALSLARREGDFDTYARILLPLQESRRQRRQLAADAGVIVLGEPRLDPAAVLDRHHVGCLMLLCPPYGPGDEQAIRAAAVERGCFVEAMAVDQTALAAMFQHQMEARGDAALLAVDPNLPPPQLVDALQAVVEQVGDHEIAHQRLAEAARRAARGGDG